MSLNKNFSIVSKDPPSCPVTKEREKGRKSQFAKGKGTTAVNQDGFDSRAEKKHLVSDAKHTKLTERARKKREISNIFCNNTSSLPMHIQWKRSFSLVFPTFPIFFEGALTYFGRQLYSKPGNQQAIPKVSNVPIAFALVLRFRMPCNPLRPANHSP